MPKDANTARGLMRRTADIYFGQKKRAKVASVALKYTLEELRRRINEDLAHGWCVYCKGPLTEENLTVDHSEPIARGGGWEIDNLTVCCKTCNLAKGPLRALEFLDLMNVVGHFPDFARKNVLARLKAGGKCISR